MDGPQIRRSRVSVRRECSEHDRRRDGGFIGNNKERLDCKKKGVEVTEAPERKCEGSRDTGKKSGAKEKNRDEPP